MSLGLSLLRAILVESSLGTFRKLTADMFTADEIVAYDAVCDHMREFGCLPHVDTIVRDEGIQLSRAREGAAYYYVRVKRRSQYSAVQVYHNDFVRAMAGQDMDRVTELVRDMVAAVTRYAPERDIKTLGDTARDLREEYERNHTMFGLPGITLGWDGLDDKTGGAQDGDIIVFVGRPGTGKTWFLIWSSHRAWLSGRSVLFISMEMTITQLARRFSSLAAGVDPELVRKGRLSEHGRETYFQSLASFEVDNRPAITFMAGNFRKTISDVSNAIQEINPDVVYIDASYLLVPEKVRKGSGSRREVISDVVEELKRIAIVRDKPLIISVQFNREQRKNTKTMSLDRIGETDVIGQVASIVVGIREGEDTNEDIQRRLEILKDREGSVGRIKTRFEFSPVDFSEISDEDAVEGFGDDVF